MGFVAVVEVGGVVGDFVGQVDQLGFERRALVEQIFGEFGMFFRVVVVRVLDDAFAHFEGQVQAAEGGVALFEIFDDAEGVQVVVEEEAVLAHGGVERFFAGVAEGRMADVVDQGQGFGEIDVEAERSGDGARDLRDFEGVGEAVAEVVGVAAGEDLRLGFEAAEGAGVDDAVAIALKVVAVGMRGFGEAASAGVLDVHRVGGQHGGSLAFLIVDGMIFDCESKIAASFKSAVRSGSDSAQPEAHFVAGLEAEGFVEMAAVVAGVESHAGEAFALAPGDHGLEEFAGDAAAAVFGIGVDVEDGGAPALADRTGEPARERRLRRLLRRRGHRPRQARRGTSGRRWPSSDSQRTVTPSCPRRWDRCRPCLHTSGGAGAGFRGCQLR